VRLHLATLVDDYRRHGTQQAVVVHRGNRRQIFTYADLANLSERFAAELIRRGIKSGDRVVLWGQNSAEWIAAFFGCVLRGVLVVPLDAAGGLDFALRVIEETQPRLLVGDASLLSGLSAELPHIDFEHFSKNLPLGPFASSVRELSLSLDTPLQILFTSGTTSEPKGIVHTHRNVLASLEPIEHEMQKYLRYERIFHPLRFLHTLPLSHVFGQFMGLWIPPLLAAEIHFESRLQAPRLLELIRRYRISVLAAVPRVLDLLKTHIEANFPNLPTRLEASQGRRVWRKWWNFRDVHREFGFKFWAFVCGGASIPPALEHFWNDLGFALVQGYGMTETAALITLNHPFHVGQGTIGKPLPGREVRIGSDGEVLVRGEMVASSRWQNGRMQTSSSPWLATGDLVEQDAEGQLHFLGRKSETIVTAAGLNIHPEDVEAALNRQQGIEASTVVPLDTPNGTEAVAVLICRGGPEQAQSAVDSANGDLAEFQRVRRWVLWPQLDFPRTAIGKIQRRKVTQWIAEQQSNRAVSSSEALDPLSNMIAAITRAEPAHLADETRLDRDLQFDSLARVQLQADLELRMGVAISDTEFEQITTIGQLRARLGLSSNTDSNALSENNEHAPLHPKPTAAHLHQFPSEPSLYRYPRWTWWPTVQWMRMLFQEGVMRPLIWLLAKPTVLRTDERRLPRQPVLLIANHVTAFDVPLVLYALPAHLRKRVAIAMSGEMLEDWKHARNQGSWLLNLLAPVAYWLVTALFNVFPLPRSVGFRSSFAHAGEAMDRGYNVLVFPEGRRSADGSLQPFRSGIGLLAKESNAVILPVALKGIGELKQKGEHWFRSHLIEIRVGEPISPAPQATPETVAESLQNAVSNLLQRGG